MVASRHDAFVALFDENFGAVLSYLRRRMRAAADAEELAADVFRLAWEKQDPADPFGRGWLFKLAADRLADHYRRQGARHDVEAALRRRLEEAPAKLELDDALSLRDALRGLSAREQEVLRLTYWDGLSAADVAVVLDCSAGSVWTTLTRARAKLHGALSEPLALGGELR